MSLFKRITRDEMYACYKTSKHQPRCHISITIHHKFLQFAGGELPGNFAVSFFNVVIIGVLSIQYNK